MRPIPAPRIGDAHGLLRAINQRERLRLDEFVTAFSPDELFPPGLENALGRMRQFVSFARSAGLLNEDRGTVELTDMGKRYVRAGDAAAPFDVAPAQAEWLRRLLRERHMTDSIFHGAAVALSLYASNPPDFHPSRVDFGRAINQLGRAGWDNENTFESQGERYTTFLTDLELVDAERRLTPIGQQTRDELTLPIHMSLKDIAGQLNPGGLEAAVREGEAEYDAALAAALPEPEPEPEPEPAAEEEAAYEDVGPGTTPGAAPAQPDPAAAAPLGPPPTPPADLWDTASPDERTRAYVAIRPEDEQAPPPPAAPAAPEPAPAAEEPDEEPEESAEYLTAGPMTAAPRPAPPAAEPPHAAPPPAAAPPAAGPPPGAPPGAPRAAPPGAEPPPAVPPAAEPPAAAPAPPPATELPPSPPPPARAPEPAAAPPPAPPAPEPVQAGMTSGDPLGAPPAPPAPAPPVQAAPEPAFAAAAAAATIASPAPGAPPAAPAFVSGAAIRAAAEEQGLRLPEGLYAAVAAALAGGHVVLVGPAGSGKTRLALAVAKAAAQAGKAGGATVVTAGNGWSPADTLGRPGDEEWERGTVVEAAARGRWLIVDELDRAPLDAALGDLSSFLAGVPVTLPDGENAPPEGWRIVATAGASGLAGSPALVRRFAHVHVPPPDDAELHRAIDEAAGGDAVAADAVKRLLGARELGPVGAGAFLAAARFAAARNAEVPAGERTLAREALAAHVAPLLGGLDEERRRRLAALAG